MYKVAAVLLVFTVSSALCASQCKEVHSVRTRDVNFKKLDGMWYLHFDLKNSRGTGWNPPPCLRRHLHFNERRNWLDATQMHLLATSQTYEGISSYGVFKKIKSGKRLQMVANDGRGKYVFKILGSDYDHFFIIHVCTEDLESTRILTRSPTPPSGDELTAIEAELKKSNLSVDDFTAVDQEKCP